MPETLKTFVILQHTLPDGSVHWDLCLDEGSVLATWQILEEPGLLTGGVASRVPVRRIADHRRAYLDYEGPVSRNRGHVRRVDRGTYCLLVQRADLWRIRFAGRVFIGTYEIVSGDESNVPGVLQRVE